MSTQSLEDGEKKKNKGEEKDSSPEKEPSGNSEQTKDKPNETPELSTEDDKQKAPFGKTVDGKPKKSPAGRKPGKKKKPEPKDGTSPPAPLRPAQRKVPVGKTVDPYAELKRSVEEQKRIVARIRRDHPESKIGDPVDPITIEANPPHEKPLIDVEVGDALKGVYKLLADLVDHDHIPSDEVFNEVGKKWANASKYIGTNLTPAQVAILSAVASTATLGAPLAISGVEKVKQTRQKRYELRLVKGSEPKDEKASRPN